MSSTSSVVNALPLALLAGDGEGPTGSVERLLTAHGHAVLRTSTGRLALARARTTRPDLIVVDADVVDMPAPALCAALRLEPAIGASTPIAVVWARTPSRTETLALLRTGAWENIGPAPDPDEILLRLGTYVRAKREADAARTAGLLDQSTGLYNAQGLARRARELGSQAFRQHGALACVVVALDLAPDVAAGGDRAAATVVRCMQTLRTTARLSDAVGRLGPTEFAIITPGTDVEGARKLGQRLATAIKSAAAIEGTAAVSQVRVAVDGVANVTYRPIEPVDLLNRASAAVRGGRIEPPTARP